jgi:beta-glucosidase
MKHVDGLARDPGAAPAPPALTLGRSDFPRGFVFSTATSAYQVEGHASGGAGRTHWDAFAEQPGRVHHHQNGAVACDHYHRWEEDLDLIAAAGLDAYRFSTSWARIMPDGATVNPEGIDFYDRLVDGMLARGLKPMATIYHWELPEALSARGGWLSRETPRRMADLAALVGRRLGDRLHSVAPVNEPWCVAWLSHFHGFHAPGLYGIENGARAMHHVALAHGLAARALRQEGARRIGGACNLEWATPATDADADRAACARYEAIYNRWFLQAFTQGTYPELALDALAPHLPEGWQDDMGAIRQPLDWMGINYYTRQRVAALPSAPWPGLQLLRPRAPVTDMGWEIAPDGLRELLLWTAREYTGALPLYVTENGLACPDDDPARPDLERIAFYDAHLRACRQAIAQGAPLRGYTAWSLMDNFEWTFGYAKRFGLVHVDFETQIRTPKASYHALAAAMAR